MAYPAYFAEFIYYEMSKEWLDPKHTYYRYMIIKNSHLYLLNVIDRKIQSQDNNMLYHYGL